MIYNDKTLILDNFRKVLKGFSVDIQDIVRSAILDGVDISDYLDTCKNNPYRLDQIRLGLKEGLDEVFFKVNSGEAIYKIRTLKNNGVSLKNIKTQLKKGSLSGECLDRLLKWTEAGYNLYGLDVSIIPRSLYNVFESGLQKGFNMSIFNNGKLYTSEYIKECMVMLSNGVDISPFVGKDIWSKSNLSILSKFSYIRDKEKWNRLISNITVNTPYEKLCVLITCVKNNIDISIISKSNWSVESIKCVIKAFENGLDYNKFISIGPDIDALSANLNKVLLDKNKKVSGRFLKK